MKTIFKYLITARKPGLIFFLILLFKCSYSQLDAENKSPLSMHFISFGVNQAFLTNNQPFDLWTRSNYNLKEKNGASVFFDWDYIFAEHFNIGVNLEIKSGYQINEGYLGVKLTSARSKISSWLNLDIGQFSGSFSNIKPYDYVLPPEGQGKKVEAYYTAGYIGLTSKNYFNFLHWNLKLGRAKIPFNGGIYAGAGFTPFSRNWRYGYYQDDTTYIAKRVYSIPKLSKVYAKAGVFVGF